MLLSEVLEKFYVYGSGVMRENRPLFPRFIGKKWKELKQDLRSFFEVQVWFALLLS